MKQVILPELEYVLFNTLRNMPEGATGYDMSKYVGGIFAKWSHQQIYRTMNRYNGELWLSTLVPQEGKPDKKVYRFQVADDIEVVSNPEAYSTEVHLLIQNKDDVKAKIASLQKDFEWEMELAKQSLESDNKTVANIATHRANMIQSEVLVLANW